MKCSACGAELTEGAKNCTACGHEVGMGQRAAEGSLHVAEKTGEVAGKVGKGIWSGAKAVGTVTRPAVSVGRRPGSRRSVRIRRGAGGYD